MIIREAKIEDIKQIQAVRNAVTENILSDASLVSDKDCELFIAQRGKGWVSEIDNTIVGFAIVDVIDHNVWALFLHPNFEKRGIGRLLHSTMLHWYFSQSKLTLWLSTEADTRAQKFYLSAGWVQVGTYGTNEIKFEMTYNTWLTSRI